MVVLYSEQSCCHISHLPVRLALMMVSSRRVGRPCKVRKVEELPQEEEVESEVSSVTETKGRSTVDYICVSFGGRQDWALKWKQASQSCLTESESDLSQSIFTHTRNSSSWQKLQQLYKWIKRHKEKKKDKWAASFKVVLINVVIVTVMTNIIKVL